MGPEEGLLQQPAVGGDATRSPSEQAALSRKQKRLVRQKKAKLFRQSAVQVRSRASAPG